MVSRFAEQYQSRLSNEQLRAYISENKDALRRTLAEIKSPDTFPLYLPALKLSAKEARRRIGWAEHVLYLRRKAEREAT